MEAFTCSGCGYTSFSKILFQDHDCAMNNDPGSPGRYCRPAPPPPPVETVYESSNQEAVLASLQQRNEMPVGISDFDETDLLNPEDAPYRCICGFSAFSQLLFEDHDCSFVTKEVIASSVRATTASRLKDAGLQIERHFVRETSEQGPQSVIVKTTDSGKVLFGPKPVEKGTSIGKLIETILEAKGQPWASLRLFHKDNELSPGVMIGSIFERTVLLTATMESVSLDIYVRKSYFNKFPDVMTEVVIRPQKEENFQDYVASVQDQLWQIYGRYRAGNPGMSVAIENVEAADIMVSLEEKPKNMSCVSFRDCVSEEQLQHVRAFLAKAGKARMWKSESFGQHYVLAWAAGHEFRLSILSEDSPSRNFVSMMSKNDAVQRRSSC